MSNFILFIYRCNIGTLILGALLIFAEFEIGRLKKINSEKSERILFLTVCGIAVVLLIINIIMIVEPTSIGAGKLIGVTYCIAFVFIAIYIVRDSPGIKLFGYAFIIIWLLSVIITSHGAYDGVPFEDTYKLTGTFEIVEVEEIPEVYMKGSRFNVDSVPGMTYYITYKTSNGEISTFAVNGAQYKVTKDIDEKYRSNPYFEEYEITRSYESFVPFINFCSFKNGYSYRLYVPD